MIAGPIVRAIMAVPPGMSESVGYETAWTMARERVHLFMRIRDAEVNGWRAFRDAEHVKRAYGYRIVTQVEGL